MRKVTITILCILLCMSSTAIISHGQQTATDYRERPIDIDTERVNVYLQTQESVVDSGDPVIFIYSITNYITNKKNLTVQLIIEAPSGSVVFSTTGAERGTGSQFSTISTLRPGEQDSIRIRGEFQNPGSYEITAQAIYYFGTDQDNGDGVEVTIPIEQRPPPPEGVIERISRSDEKVPILPTNPPWSGFVYLILNSILIYSLVVSWPLILENIDNNFIEITNDNILIALWALSAVLGSLLFFLSWAHGVSETVFAGILVIGICGLISMILLYFLMKKVEVKKCDNCGELNRKENLSSKCKYCGEYSANKTIKATRIYLIIKNILV